MKVGLAAEGINEAVLGEGKDGLGVGAAFGLVTGGDGAAVLGR